MDKNVFLKLLAVFGLMFLGMDMASAAAGSAPDFGTIAGSLSSTTTGMGKLMTTVSVFLGIGLAIGGVMGIVNAKKSQQPIGPSVIMLIAGFALASIGSLIGSGSTTIFQSQGGQGEAGMFSGIAN